MLIAEAGRSASLASRQGPEEVKVSHRGPGRQFTSAVLPFILHPCMEEPCDVRAGLTACGSRIVVGVSMAAACCFSGAGCRGDSCRRGELGPMAVYPCACTCVCVCVSMCV